jgi:hypothetical protein
MEKAGTVGIVRFDVLRARQFNPEFNGGGTLVRSKAPTRIRSKLEHREATKRQQPSMQNAQS